MGALFFPSRPRRKLATMRTALVPSSPAPFPPIFPEKTFCRQHGGVGHVRRWHSRRKGCRSFWDSGCENKWADLIKGKTINRLLIGINPGRGPKKQTMGSPALRRRGRQVSGLFRRNHPPLGGPGEEGIAREVHGNMKCEAKDLSGKLSLDDLAYLVSRLDLLVTNDSAPMHIGAATRTPLVALFGPEDPALMGPYTGTGLFRVIYKDVPCRPCSMSRCEHVHAWTLSSRKRWWINASKSLKFTNHQFLKSNDSEFMCGICGK